MLLRIISLIIDVLSNSDDFVPMSRPSEDGSSTASLVLEKLPASTKKLSKAKTSAAKLVLDAIIASRARFDASVQSMIEGYDEDTDPSYLIPSLCAVVANHVGISTARSAPSTQTAEVTGEFLGAPGAILSGDFEVLDVFSIEHSNYGDATVHTISMSGSQNTGAYFARGNMPMLQQGTYRGAVRVVSNREFRGERQSRLALVGRPTSTEQLNDEDAPF